MDAYAYRPIVTVCDVLDIGACLGGVKEFIKAHGGMIATPADLFPNSTHIQRAANGNGYGDGYGDGDGYGYGYGDGDGDGYGYGYGYGDGDGDGYGDGDGDGDGNGDGDGYGKEGV